MRTNKTLILAVAIILCGAFLSSCKTSEAKKHLKYADDLSKSIEKFEKNRKDFSKEVTETVDNTSKVLGEGQSDLPEIAHDWETKWNNIHKRFEDLENLFSKVGKSSLGYFDTLEGLSNGIKNESLKRSEIKKNTELKSKWTITYSEAARNIEKIRAILTEGDDFQRVLIASSVRQKVEQNILELKDMANKAKQIMNELEQFTIEGKKLVNQ